MGLTTSELERIADDMYKDRTITGMVYCGDCGYNLHSLPYVHRCPECGNRYNARPRVMKGIFSPHQEVFPTGDVAAALLGAPVAIWLIYTGVRRGEFARFLMGGAFGILALVFAARVYWAIASLLKTRAVARRIELQEQE